jgi:hypothetical protein
MSEKEEEARRWVCRSSDTSCQMTWGRESFMNRSLDERLPKYNLPGAPLPPHNRPRATPHEELLLLFFAKSRVFGNTPKDQRTEAGDGTGLVNKQFLFSVSQN